METRDNPIIIDGRNGSRYPSPNSQSLPQTRAASTLLGQVLLIASVGFFISAVGVYLAPPIFSPGMFWVCVIATFVLIFAVRATRKTPVLSFGMFLLLALAMGFEISPWIHSLLGAGHTGVIFNAALTTGVGMACLGMGAQIFTFNYRRVGNYALAALFGLIIIGVLGMFFHFVSPGLYAWATLAIFSTLVVVDFMRIRDGGAGATPVELAVSIYLDGINIFLALTSIFGGGSRRR